MYKIVVIGFVSDSFRLFVIWLLVVLPTRPVPPPVKLESGVDLEVEHRSWSISVDPAACWVDWRNPAMTAGDVDEDDEVVVANISSCDVKSRAGWKYV